MTRSPVQRALDRQIARLLRFPLFNKILIANALLVTLGAFVGTAVTLRFGGKFEGSGAWLAVLFTITGVALTMILNTLLLRYALQPLRALRVTVQDLDQGNFDVRVPESRLADADLATVAETLNRMLDHVQRYEQRVQDLSANVLRAQEDERHRIARELHDQIGQALTFLLVRLKIIEALPQAGPVQAELSDLRAAVAGTIDQVRKLALDLRPPALDQLGLIPALRQLARDFSDQTRVAVTFDAAAEPINIAPERATAIYRIVQEALTNVAKHAEAKQVQIDLRRESNAITVSIHDDGCGFDPQLAPLRDHHDDGPGLGLFGMEERARLLGGEYTVESTLGAGATITAIIPLNPMEHVLYGAHHAVNAGAYSHSAG
jgi:two-component system sensor histidine kinase UhpB